jgi:lysophospholipid acyltransferase (LPLAT)-like uncharacterized protein
VTDRFNKAFEFGPLDRFTLKQRLVIRLAGFVGYVAVKIIGSTLRFETTGRENFTSIADSDKLPIYSFWHDRIIAGTYFFRD